MVDSYLGEIRLFGGTYAPQGWSLCDGSLLPISGNEALYSLIGTLYGGDGRTTFALPDLRGRLPIHFGQGPGLANHALASHGGTETVVLTQGNLPPHTHSFYASTAPATTGNPGTAATLATAPAPWTQYSPATPGIQVAPFNTNAIQPVGGNAPHPNLMPSVVVTYIIATTGIYPARPS